MFRELKLAAVLFCWHLLAIAEPVHAQPEGKIIFPKFYTYHAGDDTAWAQPEFDDRDWEQIPLNNSPLKRWQGIAWARLALEVDSTLWHKPLGLSLAYAGAAEFYLDGKLLYRFGKVGASKAQEEPAVDVMPTPYSISFDAPANADLIKSRHLVAIRYSNFFLSSYVAPAPLPIFEVKIGDLKQLNVQRDNSRRRMTIHQMLLMGIFLAFALLHLLLFLFYSRPRANLYYAVASAACAFVVYLWFQPFFTTAPMYFIWGYQLLSTALTFMMLSLIRLTYALVYPERPRVFTLFCLIGFSFTLWFWLRPARPLITLLCLIVFYIAAFAEIIRALLVTRLRKRRMQFEGSWIISLGMIPLSLTGAYWLLILLDVASEPWDFRDFPTPFYAMLLLMISMSVFLARDFARTNRNLETQLLNVRRTRDVFGLFVPEPVLDKIAKEGLESIKLGGAEEGVATILFTDIRSFTAIAEKLSPNETLAFLNEFMRRMQPVIHQHSGFINQFVGDEIMAIFYLAGHQEQAIEAAIAMRKTLDQHNRERLESGEPPIDIGVGVNTGKVIWGTIGSEVRMESAIIGDTVNLASRLQNLTKQYGVGVLVSESAFRELSNPEKFCHREIDVAHVRGKTRSVVIYEFFDSDPEPIKAQKSACLSLYNRGLYYFHAEDWQQAGALFEECLKIYPEDPISHLYLERCQAQLENSPGRKTT